MLRHGGGAGQLHELRRKIDAGHLDGAACEGEGVTPGPASDVEHPQPGPEPERVDEERHLLFGPLGERVPQICRSEEAGDGIEPGSGGWIDDVGHAVRLARRDRRRVFAGASPGLSWTFWRDRRTLDSMSNDAVRAGRRVWKLVTMGILAVATVRLLIQLFRIATGSDSADRKG